MTADQIIELGQIYDDINRRFHSILAAHSFLTGSLRFINTGDDAADDARQDDLKARYAAALETRKGDEQRALIDAIGPELMETVEAADAAWQRAVELKGDSALTRQLVRWFTELQVLRARMGGKF